MKVTFIDTSVLCELLEVPGKTKPEKAREVRAEWVARREAGEQLVIPVTAIIETGNHIVQCNGDRRAAAQKLVKLLGKARSGEDGYVLNEVKWDESFIEAFCGGDSTQQSFVDLAGNRLMGGGDVALLVERDRFRARSPRTEVRIWTLEAVMGAYA